MTRASVTTNEPAHLPNESRPLSMTPQGRLRVETKLATGGIGTTAATPLIAVRLGTMPAASFTRPADTTPYAAGDLVANSVAAGSVAPMQFTVARVAAGSGVIRRPRLRKSGTSIVNASFRLHLYATAPVAANGDNGVWLTSKAADYLGSFDLVVDRAFSDGAASAPQTANNGIAFALASGSVVFGLLEATAAYTPISAEAFTVTLEVQPN